MVKIKVENESKNEKFRRIASKRTRNILYHIGLLGNCANRSTYQYKEQEIKAIFSSIDKELKRVRTLFDNPGESKGFQL